MARVSVIVPIYNTEKYLEKCLDSLVNQTFSDIEIICIENGSTDNSLNLLKEYQKKDNRIKIIEQSNVGAGAARNRGMDIAEGKYIMMVDSDDWLEPNACELAYNQIETNGNDIVIFDYIKIEDETNKIIDDTTHLKLYKDVTGNTNVNLSLLNNNFYLNGYSTNKIYNKQFLLSNSIRYPSYDLCEDYSFTIIALTLSKNISILNRQLYFYRIRKDSLSSNSGAWRDVILSRKYASDFLLEHKLYKPHLIYFTEVAFRSILYWYDKLTVIDKSIQTDFKKAIIEYMDTLSRYQNRKTKIKYLIFKYNLRNGYEKYIHPIGRCCIDFPIKKIKSVLKNRIAN